ncbi:MAG: NAD-dependent DNA ligase LigA [Lachnospiraceae bacterium]|nr:NAD-dependent DNA ligase LigA [Lachnospiraceae bacterium]
MKNDNASVESGNLYKPVDDNQLSFVSDNTEGSSYGNTIVSENTARSGNPGFNTRHEQLDFLASLGFDVVERELVDSGTVVAAIERFSDKISSNDFPSDGLVLVYDDIAYGNSLGRTSKFPRDGIAFKWADEQAETTLREVEWSASRTGLINPVAIFDPVELEGTTVSRASLHNISIMEGLRLGAGDRITVYKSNMIIPQIADNLTRSGKSDIFYCSPTGIVPDDPNAVRVEDKGIYLINPLVASHCPVCDERTVIREENDVRVLICPNPGCPAKKIKLFALMVSRDALNVDGMSEATIEKLIEKGLLHDLADIFKLRDHFEEIASIDGFGKKSCENLLAAIEKARETSLDRIIYSLGIPNIGLANAKLICRYASYNTEMIPKLTSDELSSIDGIGEVLAYAFTKYFSDTGNLRTYSDLLDEVALTAPEAISASSAITGKTFVITGSVEHFANRSEAKAFIENHGGKVTGSVTKNTDYLINNDLNSTSSKNKTAKELGIPIISEEELLNMASK